VEGDGVTNWTTVPPWLYQNDLPDDELQALYVEGARRKLAQLREERRALADQLTELEGQIAQAAAFLAQAQRALTQAQRALTQYRTPRRG